MLFNSRYIVNSWHQWMICRWMDGWMDGWVGEWMFGQIDGWIDDTRNWRIDQGKK